MTLRRLLKALGVVLIFKASGVFLPTCTGKAQEYVTAIWTELQK